MASARWHLSWTFAGAVTLVGGCDPGGGGDDDDGPDATPLPGAWTGGNSMQNARWACAVGELDGVIFMAGGYAPTTHVRFVESYDVADDLWTFLGSRPGPQTGPVSAVIDGQLYVAGGSDAAINVPRLHVYSPSTNTWVAGPDSASSHGNAPAGGAIDGIFYVAGGNDLGNTLTLDVLEAYDPVADTWTTLSSMPTARAGVSSAVVDGILYAIGGGVRGGDPALDVVEAYEPATDTWTTRAPMPTRRFDAAAGVIDGIIYVAGGHDDTSSVDTVEAYDPIADTWSEYASLPTGRVAAGGTVSGGKLYVMGGYMEDGVPLALVEIFTP